MNNLHLYSLNFMINKLDNGNTVVATQIFQIFQRSYQVEAELIGVTEFPPLRRSYEQIQNSKTRFYGYFVDGVLAAVIEVNIEGSYIEIDSLTVHPNFFRLGIASKLIRFILDGIEFSRAVVETAVVNEPAITLYEKHGFVAYKRWTPSHGIPKIALEIKV